MTDEERKARKAKRQRELYADRKAEINARRRELYALMVEQDPDRHAARKDQMRRNAMAKLDQAGGHDDA